MTRESGAILRTNPIRIAALWLAVITLAAVAGAQAVSQLQPTGYVDDFAGVLDANTKAQITDVARQIDEKAHAQIALVTVQTLGDVDIESYSVDLFHKWGIGSKSTDRGVLILYAINDHKARIEVGYGLEPILPDGKVGGFQREAIPLVQQGQYGQALLLVTNRVASTIADDAKVQISLTPVRVPARRAPESERGIS